ncbi:nucleotidyltransferase domain-containing protein [Tepidibacillus sp. HK-1]|uniref:nucleotidyltransferase domain-containing protein n=1 Tax=Tepidibacillus sp. HK-1 TaxID=1883407 RepID=UPI00085302C9|nr:nucleotidyltransferase domain-containing protein [Tepidibacillus sp. HK-1]
MAGSSLIGALSRWPEIEKASIFGSRAMGNYKNGSDVDLVIYGSQLTQEIINHLSVLLNEELPLPYYFDIIHYETLKHRPLKDHIDKYAKCFYSCKNHSEMT